MTLQLPAGQRSRSGAPSGGPIDQELMAALRRRFVHEGIVPAQGLVPEHVLRSWQRSVELGLRSDAKPEVAILSSLQLREAQASCEDLIHAARGELEGLFEDARATGGLVILTDPRGVILVTAGDPAFASEAMRVNLRAGAHWGEMAVGTSAIGSSLAEGQEMAVRGTEHFFETHHFLACSAMPILGPSGEILGLLDMTNAADVQQTHTLALVRRAVEQIERRLFARRFAGHDQMHFHSNPHMIGSLREGLIALDGDQIVGANRLALDLLGLDWPAIGTARFDQVFIGNRELAEHAARAEGEVLRTLSGGTVYGCLKPAHPRSAAPSAVPVTPVHRDVEADDIVPSELAPDKEPVLRETVERLLKGPAARHFSFKPVKSGQILYGADMVEDGDGALLIVRGGRLRCFVSFEGKELTLFTMDAGDAIHLHSHSMLDVRKDAEIVIIRMATFRQLAQSDPDLALSAVPALDRMLQKSIRMIEDMAFHGVKHRLIRVLCETADRDGRHGRQGVVIDAPPNAEDFAMQIGATRQSVSTVMAELTRSGMLRRQGASAMVIADLDRLRRELETR
jgi:CRP-like cAMP-binding protein